MSRSNASPQRGLLVQVEQGDRANPPILRGMAFLPPDPKASCSGAEPIRHWERTSYWPHSPPGTVRVNPLAHQSCPSGYPPYDLGLNSHGPNWWKPHYPNPGCFRERAMMLSTGPYVGHPSWHALSLSFPRPIGIWAKGIPKPWHLA